MAGQQGGGQEGGDKNTYYILWVIVLIVFVCGLIWWAFSEQLKTAFIAVRVYELIAIDFFLGLFPADFPWVGPEIQQLLADVNGSLKAALSLTPNNITMDVADTLSVITGEYLRYPLMIFLFLLSFVVFKTNVQMRLKKTYSMQSLAIQEEVNWPQIKITTKFDILNQDLDSGPWAMAMTPMQFAKKNKLVSIEFADLSESQFAKVQRPEFVVKLDRARTERAFSIQLGREWQGIDKMAPHRQAIFAVFIARGNRDTKAAWAMVAQLANSAAEGTLDCTGVDKLLKKHSKAKRVQDMFEAHAYEFTVFISALLFAREDGVVASADFLWVKPIDRRLWYVINNVGRQTPAVEVGGIFCHWYFEMALRRALSSPKVDGAVSAFELALSDVIYIPSDEERAEIVKRRDEAKTSEDAAESREQAAV